MFRRFFFVFVQYFRRVLKNVDNEQVEPAICDVFVCKHLKLRIVGLPLCKLGGNRENFPSFFAESYFLKEDELTFCKKAKTGQK